VNESPTALRTAETPKLRTVVGDCPRIARRDYVAYAAFTEAMRAADEVREWKSDEHVGRPVQA